MSDKTEFELVLDQPEPSFSLVLEPDTTEQTQEMLAPQSQNRPNETAPAVAEEVALTDSERNMVAEFAQQIDIENSSIVLQYGSAAQKNVANFSETALGSVRSRDLGEVGDMLGTLVKELKQFGAEEEATGIKGFFQKKKDGLETMRAGYATAEKNVERIAKALEEHQIVLMKDIAMFDQMYELNLKYYKELTLYLLAGKQRLQEDRNGKLQTLRATAERTGNPQDAQAYNDFENLCNRFEKKLHDLELTRTISIQMGPQTRLLQNNNAQMLEKLQSSLVNTIPLWKSQMVLALGLHNASKAVAAQRSVTDMTNEMLKKNADMLKMSTIETAKEAERSIVDIETLQHTNTQLISSLDAVMDIQREGAQKRKEAEGELVRIEGELRNKLLELRG